MPRIIPCFFCLLALLTTFSGQKARAFTIGGGEETQNIDVKGLLSCKMELVNTGSPCRLSIQEEKTGRIYPLDFDKEVMRMYIRGKKKVSIQGKLKTNDSILIEKVTVL